MPRPSLPCVAPIMSAYHLRARLITGPLRSPTRDEVRDVESDDRSELARLAARVRSGGFTVWIFKHGTAALPGASDLTVDERLDPAPAPPPGPAPAAGGGPRCSRRAKGRLRLVGTDRQAVEVEVEVRSLLSGFGARDRVEPAVCLLRGVMPLPA